MEMEMNIKNNLQAKTEQSRLIVKTEIAAINFHH